jgi:hypothetical protein
MDPMMMQPANAVAQMDVDIQIDEVMESPSLQIEQFEQLAKLAPMAPPQYLGTMFELMIEASNLRNKDKLREITKKLAEPQQDPMAEPMQQLQMAGAQAQVEKTQSEAAKNMAQAQATTAGVQLDAMKMGMAA